MNHIRRALPVSPCCWGVSVHGERLPAEGPQRGRAAGPPLPGQEGGPAPARPLGGGEGQDFAERLARIDRWLQQYVDENRIAGAVALVLRDGKPVYERAVGWSDKEAGRRMTTDTIFRIASQTKALTSVAILALVEEGKIGLNDPVSRFIPGFAKTTVAVATDPRPRSSRLAPDHHPRSADAHRGHLVRHQRVGRRDLREPRASARRPATAGTPPTRTSRSATRWSGSRSLPFVAQPGEAWVYGYNTDILGCVVERASGMPLDEFIRTRITGPLGMKDTQFFLPPASARGLPPCTASRADGTRRARPRAAGPGHYVDGPRRSFAGGAGLLSTARDYARFLEMIRNGGALDGVRILAPRTVELMTTNQVGTLHSPTGLGFGLGFETTDRYGANGMDSVGAFGWGGAYGIDLPRRSGVTASPWC